MLTYIFMLADGFYCFSLSSTLIAFSKEEGLAFLFSAGCQFLLLISPLKCIGLKFAAQHTQILLQICHSSEKVSLYLALHVRFKCCNIVWILVLKMMRRFCLRTVFNPCLMCVSAVVDGTSRLAVKGL